MKKIILVVVLLVIAFLSLPDADSLTTFWAQKDAVPCPSCGFHPTPPIPVMPTPSYSHCIKVDGRWVCKTK